MRMRREIPSTLHRLDHLGQIETIFERRFRTSEIPRTYRHGERNREEGRKLISFDFCSENFWKSVR